MVTVQRRDDHPYDHSAIVQRRPPSLTPLRYTWSARSGEAARLSLRVMHHVAFGGYARSNARTGSRPEAHIGFPRIHVHERYRDPYVQVEV